MNTFKIAIHDVPFILKPTDDPDFDWQLFNTSFANMEIEFMDFVNAIYLGRAYCPWMQGIRKVDNFLLAQHIAVDMDCGDQRAHIGTLAQHPLVQAYGAIIHETPSHSAAAPRARVIFLLDQPITTAAGYKAAVQTVTELFDGADPACVDSARFFFGNGKLGFYGDIDGIWFDQESCLPVAEIRRLYTLRQQKKIAPPMPPTPTVDRDYPADAATLIDRVRQAREGERNVVLNRQAFLAGKDIRAGKLRESDIVSDLVRAAVSIGLSEQEARRTVTSGLRGSEKAA